jgi:hypothetical protein
MGVLSTALTQEASDCLENLMLDLEHPRKETDFKRFSAKPKEYFQSDAGVDSVRMPRRRGRNTARAEKSDRKRFLTSDGVSIRIGGGEVLPRGV